MSAVFLAARAARAGHTTGFLGQVGVKINNTTRLIELAGGAKAWNALSQDQRRALAVRSGINPEQVALGFVAGGVNLSGVIRTVGSVATGGIASLAGNVLGALQKDDTPRPIHGSNGALAGGPNPAGIVGTGNGSRITLLVVVVGGVLAVGAILYATRKD